MHRHKHRHEPTNKTQGPSAIIAHHPSDESHHASVHPAKDPAKIRIRDTTIRSLNCTVNRTVSSQAISCPLSFAIDRSTDSTASSCLQAATLPPKDRREREKDSFTVSLSCRRPREPGTSLHPRRNQRPSTINPNLIRLPSKRPFFSPRHTVKQEHSTSPETRIHSHTSRLLDHRLASLPMLEPRLVGNISWCAHRCDVRIHTSSTANGLEGCHSSLMQKQTSHLRYLQPLSVCIASLVIHLIF